MAPLSNDSGVHILYHRTYPPTSWGQEHINISIATSNRIISDWLHPDFNIAERPFNRSGQVHHQTVSKPVAYTYKDKVFFWRTWEYFYFRKWSRCSYYYNKFN